MKVQVFSPKNTTIKSLIESYVAVETIEPIELRTIPNGRVDASIVLEGTLEWFFKKSNAFERLPSAAFYPATRTGGLARAQDLGYYIGIKFYPHILTLPTFENKKLKEPLGFDEFFNTPTLDNQLINDLKQTKSLDQQTQLLDTYFLRQFFLQALPYHWIQEIIQTIEKEGPSQIRIGKIADSMGVSIKTLERRFQKTIGLTPKSFSTIIQLHQATKKIQKKNSILSHGDLTEALGSGYYDQSHFIKSCKRITGLTPKNLFTHLPTEMTDLVIIK